MSKVNDIKNMKRNQKVFTPKHALAAKVGTKETTNVANNVCSNEETKQPRKKNSRVERKRVSFDLRTDLHKESFYPH